MEVNLESLIAKIKKDGIEEARRSAQEILDKARSQAKEILAAAEKEAAGIIAKAEKDSQRLTSNTKAALRQASRDLILSLRQEVRKLLEAVFEAKIAEQLDANFLRELIIRFVSTWPESKDVSFEVLLNKDDAKKLQSILASSLKETVAKTVEIKVSKTVNHGFRIGPKGENLYYDFSDEAILEALKVFLNPAAAQLLDSDNG